MIKSIIITLIILISAAWLTFSGAGYSSAGESYISEVKKERKTIRPAR